MKRCSKNCGATWGHFGKEQIEWFQMREFVRRRFGFGLAHKAQVTQEMNAMTSPVNKNTVFFGHGVLKLEFQPGEVVHHERDQIEDCEVPVSVDGEIPNSARAFQRAGGGMPVTGLITGVDQVGNLLSGMAQVDFPIFRRVATAVATCVSASIPRKRRANLTTTWIGGSSILDEEATFSHVQPWLSSASRLVIGSFLAHDATLVQRLISGCPGETCLLLSRNQCEDRETTITLARQCLCVLNATDLAVWTGVRGDAVSGIYWLREHEVTNVIVMDDKRGIIAFLDGEWHHQPAFRVDNVVSPGQSNDAAIGTYLAARDQKCTIRDALRFAAAASAMLSAGIVPRRIGLQDLIEFAATTSTRPYGLDGQSLVERFERVAQLSEPFIQPAAFLATGAAAVVFMMALVIGFV